MGTKFAKETLLATLKMAAAFAGKFVVMKDDKPTETALMRLEFNGWRLIIEATDGLMSGIHTEMPAPGNGVKTYELPAKLLLDAVSAAVGDEVELVCEKTGLTVKGRVGKATINAVAGNIIPPIDQPGESVATDFTCAEMKRAIDLVSPSAERNGNRPGLAGVRIAPDRAKNTVTFAATDGVRMAVYTTPTVRDVGAFKEAFTLPIETVGPLTDCLSKQAGNVGLTVTGSRATFHWHWQDADGNTWQGYAFAQRQVDNFPEWQALIPRTCKTRVSFDEKLAAALRTTRVIAREVGGGMQPATMTISDKTCVVASEVSEVGSTSTEVTPIQVEGEQSGVSVSFNISLIPTQQIGSGVVIGLNPGRLSPIVMRAPAVEGWTYVLMPLQAA